MKRYAFTMIELVFVIVILGILAAVAIPKMTATRDDAVIVKFRSDISSLRSAIMKDRQSRMMSGGFCFVNKLDALSATTSSDGDKLFDTNGTAGITILGYPAYANSKNGWSKIANNEYNLTISNGGQVTFTYDPASGIFDCDHTEFLCKTLTE